MSLTKLLSAIALSSIVLACPQHGEDGHAKFLNKRTGGTDWAYEASYNWGMINPNYTLCQTGTQQSPIQLLLTQGLANHHRPDFSAPTSAYSAPIAGSLYNWGYGPAFSVAGNSSTVEEIRSKPSFTYDNITLYLQGWHIHAPADHTVQGDRSKAELHLVHVDESGHEAGVVSIRIDPGNSASPFFAQFLSSVSPGASTSMTNTTTVLPSFHSTEKIAASIDMMLALQEVNMFSDFWTYEGSLTSPPCREGVRWWVARNTMFVSVEQMQQILGVSTYSSRVEQEVWMHAINV